MKIMGRGNFCVLVWRNGSPMQLACPSVWPKILRMPPLCAGVIRSARSRDTWVWDVVVAAGGCELRCGGRSWKHHLLLWARRFMRTPWGRGILPRQGFGMTRLEAASPYLRDEIFHRSIRDQTRVRRETRKQDSGFGCGGRRNASPTPTDYRSPKR